MRTDKFMMAKAWMKQDQAPQSEARDTWNMMEAEFNDERKAMLMANAETDKIKAMMNEQYGPGTVKYGSEIKQPEIKTPQAAFEFSQRNPAADGGQMVKPNADGSRPGYQGDETFLVKVGKPLKVKNVIEQEFIEVTGSKNRPETYKKTGVKKTLYKPQIIIGNKTVLTTNFGTKDAATSAVEKYREKNPIKNAPPDLDTLDKQKKKKYLAKREKSAKIIAGDGVERFATGDDIIDKGHAQNINNPDIKIKPRNIIYTPKKINQSMAGQGANISPTDLDFKINVTENKIKDIKKSNMSGAKKKIDLEKLDTKLMKYVAQSDGYKTVTLSDGQVYGEIFQKEKSMDMFDEFLGTEKETKKFVNQYFNDKGKLKDKWHVNKNGFLKNNPSIKLSDIDRANIKKSYTFLENIENAKANARSDKTMLQKFCGYGQAQGGRIGLSNGSCSLDESQKGFTQYMEDAKNGKISTTSKAGAELAENAAKLAGKSVSFGKLFFGWTVAPEVVLEGAIGLHKYFDKGENVDQVLAKSYLTKPLRMLYDQTDGKTGIPGTEELLIKNSNIGPGGLEQFEIQKLESRLASLNNSLEKALIDDEAGLSEVDIGQLQNTIANTAFKLKMKKQSQKEGAGLEAASEEINLAKGEYQDKVGATKNFGKVNYDDATLTYKNKGRGRTGGIEQELIGKTKPNYTTVDKNIFSKDYRPLDEAQFNVIENALKRHPDIGMPDNLTYKLNPLNREVLQQKVLPLARADAMNTIGMKGTQDSFFKGTYTPKEKPVYDFSEGGITGLRSKYEYKK